MSTISDTRMAELILGAIRGVLGQGQKQLHEPSLRGNEWAYVKECLDTNFVSSVGKFVDRFEKDLAAFTGAKHAIAVVNGTAALHTALVLAGVEPTDEVLTPALTFVATANAIAYAGASPHFVDSRELDLGIDAQNLREYLKKTTEIRQGACFNTRTGKRIRAIVPMHVFGHPSDLDGILAIAQDFRIRVVEDAAESIGSLYHGRHTGTFGLIGTLSFNGNKTITTGGGGALLTDDSDLARRAKHITTTAKKPHPWLYEHDQIGFNYRMPNINAALGCAQLEELPDMLAEKRSLFVKYKHAFSNVNDVRLMDEPPGCRSNFWLQTLVLSAERKAERDSILQATNENGIMTRPIWTLLHKLAPFRDCPRMEMYGADSLEQRVINIPSGSALARKSA